MSPGTCETLRMGIEFMETDKKDVLINIRGVHSAEDQDDDIVELFTNGIFYKEGDRFIIQYDESDATGYEGCQTTLEVEGNERVTLVRSGPTETHLVVQNGIRHQGLYDLGFGEIIMGVSGLNIQSALHELGGTVMFHYSLDINSIVASENKMTIEIKEREPDAAQ